MLKFVLLGLINLHPSVSGYELKSIIDKSTRYFFSASLSQIYPTLKTMFEEGWVIFGIEPLLGKQDRKVYTITKKGREELLRWLRTPLKLESSLSSFQTFLLRLSFSGPMDKESLLLYFQNGLNHYLKEEKAIIQQRLTKEANYLDPAQMDYDRSLFLWKHEYDYITRELRLRIESIEKMIESVRNDSSWDS